jgi:hypothetical protein
MRGIIDTSSNNGTSSIPIDDKSTCLHREVKVPKPDTNKKVHRITPNNPETAREHYNPSGKGGVDT